MKAFNEQVIARSISNLTNSGIDNLDKNQRYLFVSNHRDIMLDATILQYILHLAGHPTSEISFGSNLMKPQLVVDIGKSNKMYKIIRGGSMKDFYTNSLHLSEYIHYALHTKKESVWIAQGNGRTKNGADITEPGIIKMFYLSDQTNPAQTLASLNIVPVSISYQWETCDQLKALELYITQRDGKYVKQPDEDLHSILNGINQYKGHVHIHFGAPITTSDLAPFENQPHNTFNKNVAALITHRINSGYQLSCNNYIAADLISQSTQYADKYTDDERQKFLHHYHSATNIDVEDKALLLNIFLNIYANPVKNHPHHEK
jgi:1-acyl-sn-glycerol-3-phosphate acyltransferase